MIIWERQGVWAAWLRQISPILSPAILEVRTAESCWEAIRMRPHSPVAIEFPAGQWSQRLAWTLQFATWGSARKCLIGLLDTTGTTDGQGTAVRLGVARSALWEAGIAVVLESPRDLSRLEPLLARHASACQAPRATGPKSA